MKATQLRSVAYCNPTHATPAYWQLVNTTGFGHFKIIRAEAKWSRAGEGFGVELVLECNGLQYAQFFPAGSLGILQGFGVSSPLQVSATNWSTFVGHEAWGILAYSRLGVRFVAFSKEEPKTEERAAKTATA